MTPALRPWWQGLALRERRLVGAALVLVLLALVWWLALAPAFRTLTGAGAEHARLDAQLQRMNTLAARAQALKAAPAAPREDALAALQNATRTLLGEHAQLAGGGAEGANVLLRAAPADALAQWLAQARGNARALPREAHLTRAQGAAGAQAGNAPTPNAAPGADAATVRWDGTLVMNLPQAR